MAAWRAVLLCILFLLFWPSRSTCTCEQVGVGLGKDVLDEHIERMCWKFLTDINTPPELIDATLVKKVIIPTDIVALGVGALANAFFCLNGLEPILILSSLFRLPLYSLLLQVLSGQVLHSQRMRMVTWNYGNSYLHPISTDCCHPILIISLSLSHWALSMLYRISAINIHLYIFVPPPTGPPLLHVPSNHQIISSVAFELKNKYYGCCVVYTGWKWRMIRNVSCTCSLFQL